MEIRTLERGVGQTAMFTALMRHLESQRPDALFHDPLAQVMLEALENDRALAAVSGVVDRANASNHGYSEYFAVRTRFLDDRLCMAMRQGIPQVVALAAGLDGRTVRLACPQGTNWFEVDVPEMIEFKDALLTHSKLPTTCHRHLVAADLTGDWETPLTAAGFDPALPTAWLVEGLLMYLTEEAGEDLMARLTVLSAPGSRLFVEHLQAKMLTDEGKPARDRVQEQGAVWLSACDDMASWLSGNGWTAAVYAGDDPLITHGRRVAPLPACWLVSASLASSGAAIPDRDELVARAATLRPELWAQAATSDRDRRVPQHLIEAITAAGLMRLMTPRRLGGYQTDMHTFLEVVTELGKGCCSASWVTAVLNAGNFVASLFPAEAQDEVWGDNPDARTALVLGAPRAVVEDVDGGVVVSGEWPYASGSMHAEWAVVLVPRGTRSTDPEVHLVLLSAREIEVRDTWHFAGMRGTGSHTVVAHSVFVPHHRAVPFLPLLNGEAHRFVGAEHRYRDSLMGMFSVGLLGPLLGGTRSAFEYVLEQGSRRPVAASIYANQTESPSFQFDLADAITTIDTAELLAHRLAETVDRNAQAGELADLVTRTRARIDSTRVVELCRTALDRLMTAYGSSAFAESNPLQRIWRDVNAGSRHAAFGMGVPQQLHGRALIGKDPREISFLL